MSAPCAGYAGRVGVNRLDLLKANVEGGGGLMLAGGYMGFQGMFGTVRFHDTAVEDVLPVRCLPFCDGVDAPQGLQTSIVQSSHPIFTGVEGPLPPIRGLNKLDSRSDGSSRLLATCRHRGADLPLLAAPYRFATMVAAARSLGRPTSAHTGFPGFSRMAALRETDGEHRLLARWEGIGGLENRRCPPSLTGADARRSFQAFGETSRQCGRLSGISGWAAAILPSTRSCIQRLGSSRA
jgi:Putative glutamine amidotransferase